MSFASELPCERSMWIGDKNFTREILDCSPGSVDLTRMNSGAALMVNHDSAMHVGVSEMTTVGADKKVRGVFRFGSSALAKEIFNDVADGIRTLVSVGYRILKWQAEKSADGLDTLRAILWEPYEVSIVSVPLDNTVGVGRSAGTEQKLAVLPMNIKLDSSPQGAGGGGTSPPAVATPSRDDLRKEILNQHSEIRAIAKFAGVPEMGEQAINDNMLPDAFRQKAFEHLCKGAKPIIASTPEIGMSKKEIRSYSIVRALRIMANQEPHEGLEFDCSRETAKRTGRKPQGFFIPHDISSRSLAEAQGLPDSQLQILAGEVSQLRSMVMASRALTSNVFSAGGALVGVDLLTGSLIELLRNAMHVMALGARNLTGLVGDVAIPRITGGATAYWLAQGAAVTRTTQATGQLGLTPHRLVAATAYDKQLLAQSSLSVEQFVREDLMTVLAIEKDRACINGSGANGEPLGILNTTGLSTLVTFTTAATPTFAEIVRFETNLATNNADGGSLGYLTTPAVRGNAKTTAKFANTANPIWENDAMNGYPARATNQVPTTKSVIFGNWRDLIVGDWDGLDVVVDPYSLSLNGQISVVIQTLTDIGIRHAVSFTNATN